MMFSPNTVSQSLLDAVNNVMSEEKKDVDVTKSQVKKIAKTEVDKAEKAEKDENCECEVKEEVESIDEAGVMDTIKKVAKAGAGVAVKAAKALGGPDDEGHRKDLQKKMGAKPEQQNGMKSMAKYNEGSEFSFKARLLEQKKAKEESMKHEKAETKAKEKAEEKLEEHTTDTLAGREDGGVSNDFKSFKSRLKGDDTEKAAPNKTIPSNANQESIKAKGGAVPSPKIGVAEEVEEDTALLEEILDFMQTEEYEQLDELKKSTLASYVKKASHDVGTKSAAAGRYGERTKNDTKNQDFASAKKNNNIGDKAFGQSWKRREGMAKAVDRLAKEEVEQIEELSKGTLSSYANKAATSAVDNLSKANDFKGVSDRIKTRPAGKVGDNLMDRASKLEKKHQTIANKRTAGFIKATTRLKKEDVELDEGKDPNMDAGCGAAPDFATSGSTSSNPVVARVKGITSSAMTKVKSNILANKSGK